MVGFHMETYEGCKQLWKLCIDYHAFFRYVVSRWIMYQVDDSLSLSLSLPLSSPLPHRMAEIKLPVRSRSFLHRSNRHRMLRVERTEQQAIEANREAALRRSKSVRVVRYVELSTIT